MAEVKADKPIWKEIINKATLKNIAAFVIVMVYTGASVYTLVVNKDAEMIKWGGAFGFGYFFGAAVVNKSTENTV
jgi:hypothetical protein